MILVIMAMVPAMTGVSAHRYVPVACPISPSTTSVQIGPSRPQSSSSSPKSMQAHSKQHERIPIVLEKVIPLLLTLDSGCNGRNGSLSGGTENFSRFYVFERRIREISARRYGITRWEAYLRNMS